MLKKAVIVAGAVAGLLALAPVANADSEDNDGVNVLNDNKVSVPVQACGNSIPAVGAVLPLASSDSSGCAQGGVADH